MAHCFYSAIQQKIKRNRLLRLTSPPAGIEKQSFTKKAHCIFQSNHAEGKLSATKGFTLLEVLLALVVIAIALTALIKATGQTIANTQRVKDKTLSHWVAMQAISMTQLGLTPINASGETTRVTKIFDQRWYWRAKITPTAIHSLQQITIMISKNQAGPFNASLIGFKFHEE